jgi:integrase
MWYYCKVERFSAEVCCTMAGAWKDSTLGQYAAHVRKFQKYMASVHPGVEVISLHKIIEFAGFLRSENNLKTTTIRTIISVIKNMANICAPHLNLFSHKNERMIATMLRGLAKNDFRSMPSISWCISDVLRLLEGYDDVDFSSTEDFEHSSGKLIVLLMIAGGLRISEMMNLSRAAFSFQSGPCSITWGFIQGFFCKTESGLNRFTPFRIQGIHNANGELHSNCVVCYTKSFIRHSAARTKIPTLLFNKKGGTPMATVRANTLFKQVVYQCCPGAVSPFSHDLRKLAASLAWNHRAMSMDFWVVGWRA